MLDGTKEFSDDDLKDMIREGLTSKKLKEELRWRFRDIQPDSLRRLRKLLADHESGRNRIACAEDDKRRILKLYAKVMRDAGWSEKEIEEELSKDPPKFIE